MKEASGVIDATSCGAVVNLGFYPAHIVVGLSSGGPIYFSLTSSAGTTAGMQLNSTSVSPLQFRAIVNAPAAGSSTLSGRATEFGPYISGKATAGITGGIRYWALSL
jgi:hypothetical protein